ncbi:MAG: DNA-3-methyladenine glycosylase [Candidatus Aegiribacteria sp.]
MEEYVPAEEEFFLRTAPRLAPRLLGCLLMRNTENGPVSGVIVETEAYTRDDPASHSFGGKSARNWPMFKGGGLAYVYLIYGVHNCFNVTSGHPGSGEAVLVRAVRPLEGIEQMRKNRGLHGLKNLCSGPGKLCQAFGIDRGHNGTSLLDGDIRLMVPAEEEKLDVAVSRRVGISRARELKRRFTLRDSPWLSRRV